MKLSWKKVNWLKAFPVVLFAGIIISGLLKAFTTDEISILSTSAMFACCAVCHKLEIKKYESAKLDKLIDGVPFNEDDIVAGSGTGSYQATMAYLRARMIIFIAISAFFLIAFLVCDYYS